MSDTAVVAARLQEIRRIIARHKRWDLLFALLGLCALMLGVLTFVSLFAQMVVEGGPRLSVDFFTNFPSRRPEQAGILSAWVGSTLVMIVTALAAVPWAWPPGSTWRNTRRRT